MRSTWRSSGSLQSGSLVVRSTMRSSGTKTERFARGELDVALEQNSSRVVRSTWRSSGTHPETFARHLARHLARAVSEDNVRSTFARHLTRANVQRQPKIHVLGAVTCWDYKYNRSFLLCGVEKQSKTLSVSRAKERNLFLTL